jgi:glutamate synthase (ferredoxin)
MRFIAQDLREIMASLGFRTLNEMVGWTDILESKQAIKHWKAKNIDLSNLLYQPEAGAEVGRYQQIAQDHGLAKSLDITTLLDLCQDSILHGRGSANEHGTPTKATLPICNVNRAVGTILGNEITKKHWHGLPEDTVHLHFQGSAGPSNSKAMPTTTSAKDLAAVKLSSTLRPNPPLLLPKMSSSATLPSTEPPAAAKSTSTAWQANGSVSVTLV